MILSLVLQARSHWLLNFGKDLIAIIIFTKIDNECLKLALFIDQTLCINFVNFIIKRRILLTTLWPLVAGFKFSLSYWIHSQRVQKVCTLIYTCVCTLIYTCISTTFNNVSNCNVVRTHGLASPLWSHSFVNSTRHIPGWSPIQILIKFNENW